MFKPRPAAYKCIASSCPQRKENCEIHKTQNQTKLENRAKILKAENNIDFIFMGIVGNNFYRGNKTDNFYLYSKKQDTALMGDITETPLHRPEIMDTSSGDDTSFCKPESLRPKPDEIKINSISETQVRDDLRSEPLHPNEILYTIDPSPLKLFLEKEMNHPVDEDTFKLGKVLAMIKDLVIKEKLFDPANDTIILCSDRLESVLNMRALHIMQLKNQILPQMCRLSNQSEVPCEHKPSSSSDIIHDEEFYVPPKLAGILFHDIEKGAPHPKRLKFMEVLKLTTAYVKQKEDKLFDDRNKEVAIVTDDDLGVALGGIKAFHKFQLVSILKKILIPCSSPSTLPSTTSRPPDKTRLNNSSSWPSPSQSYSSITTKSILKPRPIIKLRNPVSRPVPGDDIEQSTAEASCQGNHNKENVEKNSMVNLAIECYLKSEKLKHAPASSTPTTNLNHVKEANPSNFPLLWEGPTSNLDELIAKEGTLVKVPPVDKATLLFMHIKGRTRPLATLFDTGCTTSLVRKSVLGSEIMASELKKAETTLVGFGGVTQPLDRYAFYISDLSGSLVRMEGHAVDSIVNVKEQDMSLALINLKLDSLAHRGDNRKDEKGDINVLFLDKVQNAEVCPSYGGEIDVVIGMNYIKYFPDLIFRSSFDLGLFRLNLLSHSPQYKYCLGGSNPWEEDVCLSTPRTSPYNTCPSPCQLYQDSTLFTMINEKTPSTLNTTWTPTSSTTWPTSTLTCPDTMGTPIPTKHEETVHALSLKVLPLNLTKHLSLLQENKSTSNSPLETLSFPSTNCRTTSKQKYSTGKVRSLKRLMRDDLNPRFRSHGSIINRQSTGYPTPPPETRPIFVGTYDVRAPVGTWPTTGQLLRRGSNIPSLNYFQMLLRGKSRALLTLFSPQHCGILVRSDILGQELDFKLLTKDTVKIALPHASGEISNVNAHRITDVLDVSISNRDDAIMAMSSPRYDQSSRPYKTQPHLDGPVDILIGFTAKRFHPRPILNRKTGIKLFKTDLKPHHPSYMYCAEGLYNLKGYLSSQTMPPSHFQSPIGTLPPSLRTSNATTELTSYHSLPRSSDGHCLIIAETAERDTSIPPSTANVQEFDNVGTNVATFKTINQVLVAKPQRSP